MFFYTNATIIIAKPVFCGKYIPDYVESQGLDYAKSSEKSVKSMWETDSIRCLGGKETVFSGNMRIFLACGNFLVETT